MNAIPVAWRAALLQLGLLLALLVGAQWNAVSGMAEIWWRSDTFAHGLLVLPIALWLVWRLRADLVPLQPRPWAPALLPLAAVSLLVAVGGLAEVNVLQHFGFVFSLQALVLLVLGPRVAWQIAFPLAFLLFAPPFGEFLVQPMMVQTADFTVGALRLIGIPVFREGLQFVIPSGSWSVVEACSGLRYLFASFMVGTLFAYLNFDRWGKRIAFMAFALAVPVLANWVRALLIVLLGHFSDNRIATGADHLVYGWVFFGFIMMLMFWCGSRWADALPPARAAGQAPAAAAAPPAWASLITALAVLLLPAWGTAHLRAAEPAALPANALQALAPAGGWQQAAEPGLPWQPQFVAPTLQRRGHWQREGSAVVTLDLGFYSAQRKESKAVNSMNVLVPSKDSPWIAGAAQGGSSRWTLRDGRAGAGTQLLARRLYWVDGRFTASEREAKLWGLWQQLRGRGDAQALLVLATADEAGQGAARLDAFWQALQAPLNERLSALAAEAGRQNPPR